MDLTEKIKQLEQYICEHFEELELDDPVEEGYYSEYEQLKGAVEDALRSFEDKFKVVLPEDIKALYRYKNGSGYFSILPAVIGRSEMNFCLMSLQEMDRSKEYFQNTDALLTDFPDHFTPEEIEKMRDSRIQPYLFNKKWIPFAQYCDSCFLMLDFAPGADGKAGQILCYIHDPDEVVYVAESITELITMILRENGLAQNA